MSHGKNNVDLLVKLSMLCIVGCWTTVAKHLPGRTDNMVIQRYRRLVSWQKANTKLLNMQVHSPAAHE